MRTFVLVVDVDGDEESTSLALSKLNDGLESALMELDGVDVVVSNFVEQEKSPQVEVAPEG